MKLIVIVACVFLPIGTFVATDPNVEHGIQFLSPNNAHSFVLEIDELENVLDFGDLKDRHVVVVSIAGGFR